MRNFIKFIKNIWMFRKSLWNFRWWDYHYTLEMMKTCLKIMSDNLETKGLEVDESRMKKVEKMRRAIQIINNFKDYSHMEMAEKELGELVTKPFEFKDSESHPGSYEMVDNDTPEEKEHNRKVFYRTQELEEQEWEELWDIFRGQDIKKYKPKKQDWNDWFDGTGARGWWD